MIERLLLTVLFALFALAIFITLRFLHTRRVSRAMLSKPVLMSGPTLLYFRSDSCAPCVTQASYLQALEQQIGGQVSIQKIDADTESNVASHFGIFTLPTTLIIDKGGEVRHINYGLTAATKLAQQLESIE